MKISEIITIQELPQPSDNIKKYIYDNTTVHHHDTIYYNNNIDGHLVVASKTDTELLGYAVCVIKNNLKYTTIQNYIVPQNLYSWANDHGKTALSIIKSVINISNVPVLSDLELSPSAKKFLERSIDSNQLRAKTFNLTNGDVTAYDPSIWKHDDTYRVLIMNEHGTNPHTSKFPIYEGTWNWSQLAPYL